MRQVFVFEKVAVVVGPWWEPMDPPERGARVEVRLVTGEPHRGNRFAAQRIVVDQPVFRADLFDQIDAPPGNLHSAHFHEGFDGVEPRVRQWPPAIKQDPIAWLRAELSDLENVLVRAGHNASLATDAAALRDALDAIVAAVEASFAVARAGVRV